MNTEPCPGGQLEPIAGRLRDYEGSDALGNGDFSLLREAADEIERLEAELAGRNGIITRLKHLQQSIPLLENCGRYYAQDNAGQWHYLNHARTWQAYFYPMAKDRAESDQALIRRMAAALHGILFQVLQGQVLDRDACVTTARAAYLEAVEVTREREKVSSES